MTEEERDTERRELEGYFLDDLLTEVEFIFPPSEAPEADFKPYH